MQICRGLAQAMDVLQGRWLDCREGVESSFSLEDWASTLRLKPLKDTWVSTLWQHVFADTEICRADVGANACLNKHSACRSTMTALCCN